MISNDYLKKYFFLHEVDAHPNQSHPEENIKRAEDDLGIGFPGADILVDVVNIIIAGNCNTIKPPLCASDIIN